MGELDELMDLGERWLIQYDPIVETKALTGRETPGLVIRETLEHLVNSGGDADKVIAKINAKLGVSNARGFSSVVSLPRAAFFDDAYQFSSEMNFLVTVLSKIVKGDPNFCYESDQVRYHPRHKLYEIAPLCTSVFIDPEKEKGVSCANFKAAIETVRDLSKQYAKSRGLDVGRYSDSQVELLINTFNVLIGDGESYVDEEKLGDSGRWATYPASQFLLSLGPVITGREDFTQVMSERNFPFGVRLLLRMLGVGQTFTKIAGIANGYNQLLDIELAEKGARKAVITVNPGSDLEEIALKRLYACMELSCDVSKHTMAKIPRLFGLPMQQMKEDSCCVEGAMQNIDGVINPVSHGDRCQYTYRWFPLPTGLKRVLSPTFLLALANLGLMPAVYYSGLSPFEKGVSIASGLVAVGGSAAIKKILLQRQLIADQGDYVVEHGQTVERQLVKMEDAERRLREGYLKKSLTYAMVLLQEGNYDQAVQEFQNCLELGPLAREYLLGYGMALMKGAGGMWPELHSGHIKAVPVDFDVGSGSAELVKRYFFKSCRNLDSAVSAQKISRVLGDCAMPVAAAFGNDAEGYALVEILGEQDNPSVALPNLLDIYEREGVSGELLTDVIEIGAQVYVKLLDASMNDPSIVESDDFITSGESMEDYLKRVIPKVIGVPGSSKSFTQGLSYLVQDSDLLVDLKSDLWKFLHTCSFPEGFVSVACDLSWRNMVPADRTKLVDFDRITRMPTSRYLAVPTEMSGVIKKELVEVADDLDVGDMVIVAGEQLRADNLFAMRLAARVNQLIDTEYPHLSDGRISSENAISPGERFVKALSHFGSFAWWAYRLQMDGDIEGSIRMKNHGLQCLDNAVVDIRDVELGYPTMSAEQTSVSRLRTSLESTMSDVLAHQLTSDLHIHGALSLCVARKYDFDLGKASNKQKLNFLFDVVDEKLSLMKGKVEHVSIVEHFGVRSPGVPFEDYMRVFDSLKKKHGFGFARMSFGVELDVTFAPDGGYCLMDADKHKEFITRADAVLLSVHGAGFRIGGSLEGNYLIFNTDQYVAVMTGQANLLADLKTEHGPGKIYVMTHPWKCAADINARNKISGASNVLEHPSCESMAPIYEVLFRNGLCMEINQLAIDRDESDVLTFPNPIVKQYLRHCSQRKRDVFSGRRPAVVFSRDAHHKDDLALHSTGDVFEAIPALHYAWCNVKP
ncbi:tetratricopeptide repeat protein [Nanoarchaeota archaeon]